MLVPALVIVGLAVGVPLGIYGRWSGWGFGLGWWGRPTPVRVVAENPLAGAEMKGGAEWAVTEAAHRVELELEVLAPEVEPYSASTITWSPSSGSWSGRTVVARVSRTRPRRVHVPRDAPDAPEGDGTY